MCRFLLVNTKKFDYFRQDVNEFIKKCRNSQEEQKDGWGMAYLESGQIKIKKDLRPIWESFQLDEIPKTSFLLLHARSALDISTIYDLENNQPFFEKGILFVFNGLLKGVNLKVRGRIGAQKIFNLIVKEVKDSLFYSVGQSIQKLKESSIYVRALNLLIIRDNQVVVSCNYNEDPDYFSLYYSQSDDKLVICSEKLESAKIRLNNNQIILFNLFNSINQKV